MSKQKSTLRQKYLAIRKNLDQKEAAFIAKSFINHAELFLACGEENISYYRAIGSELDPIYFIQRLIFFLPKTNFLLPQIISDQEMIFVTESGKEIIPNIAFIPLICVDLKGNRINYGKGYYDRYLGKHPDIVKIGICYHAQLNYELIEPEPHDQRLDYILTEKTLIKI